MSFEQTIATLLIALPLVFCAGYLVGNARHEPPPSAIPSNMDVAALVTSERAAKQELVAYRDLVVKVAEGCRTEAH